jgi:Antirestriction protein (ArdA)
MPTTQLSIETEDFITYLQDRNYAVEDMHDFIEAHGEDNFRKYYEEYVDLGEKYEFPAVDAFISIFGIDDMAKHFEDAYRGKYAAFSEYADDLFQECWGHQIPEEVFWYIDMDSYARDLLNSGHYYTEDNYVFCDY